MGKLFISFIKFRFGGSRVSLAVLAFTKGKREEFLQTCTGWVVSPKFARRSETVNPDAGPETLRANQVVEA